MDNHPKCPKCESTTFQVRDYGATGGTVRMLCCAQCGAVLGTTNFVEDEQRLSRMAQLLERLAQQFGR